MLALTLVVVTDVCVCLMCAGTDDGDDTADRVCVDVGAVFMPMAMSPGAVPMLALITRIVLALVPLPVLVLVFVLSMATTLVLVSVLIGVDLVLVLVCWRVLAGVVGVLAFQQPGLLAQCPRPRGRHLAVSPLR